MSQTATFDNLTSRLNRIDREVSALRRALNQLPQTNPALEFRESGKSWEWVHKDALREQMQAFLKSLGIQGSPIGAVALQNQMSRSNLTHNEVSLSLVAAREE